MLLRFAILVAGVSGALRTECDVSTNGGKVPLVSRISDLLSPRPSSQYKTYCGATPPELETWHSEEPCDEGLLFVAPGEVARGTTTDEGADVEGPAIFRTNGELVWTQSGWGRTRDLRVQAVGDRSYMTFWRGASGVDDGAGGSYVLLDQSYEMVKEIRPIGEISSRPVELKLTDNGTAIIVMHNITQTDRLFGGFQSGWINDAIIQEVDLTTNKLVSEWRASQHFDVIMSQVEIENQGRTRETAVDFFRATSIDLDHHGNYVISSRNMCNAAAVRRSDGEVLWVLGGALNSFVDGSAGQAAAMVSSQGIAWHGDSILLLLGGGHLPEVEGRAGRRTHVRAIHIDTAANTTALIRTYNTPVGVAASRGSPQGSVQRLGSGNVFVGWGDSNLSAAAYTEYSPQGQMLCSARFREAARSAKFRNPTGGGGGRVVSKHAWTGAPTARPVMAVRPQEGALYVSWNGDTRTTAWLLRSNNTERRDGSLGARRVAARTGFETRIPIPRDVGEVIEVVAVDAQGKTLVRSELIWSEGASDRKYLSTPIHS
ncbi:hypothetical protein ISF_02651 [Cordyceps fumosorosea ARSEF 2679]|uniref:Arylsulfotransferase n=1 Tax=Cordyceps fumosorosea (strain ARSEF 2679) TaxID=1081104 RepID=A0A168BXM1_CORFA|nr:hypothetical protein ISF_02651 [Cordyceps fumosorosea ARSEF 2679]OAA70677.1 hypothetical protein ISF_02651 [Cordyceps fumosorosea ARSEF 2679]